MRDPFRPAVWTVPRSNSRAFSRVSSRGGGGVVWACLGTILGLLAWPAPGRAAAPIELRPEQLTIHAERGDTVTRTIQLRLNEDLLNLRAQPMELLSERHDGAVPVDMITVTPAPDLLAELPPPRTVSFTLTLKLRGVAAGEYSGAVPFTYQGGELKLPLKLSVRHAFPLPLLVLLGGVLSSMGLSAYRARGRPRDQVLVRLGLVRAFMQRDRALSEGIPRAGSDDGGEPGLAPILEPAHPAPATGRLIANPFRARIYTTLLDVEMGLQSERWEEARTRMEQADALLRKWIAGRLGWIYQIAYLGRLEESLSLRARSSRYLQAVRSLSSDLITGAPMLESPQALREASQKLTDHLSAYQQLDAKLQALEGLRSQLPPDLVTPFTLRVTDLRTRLEDLRPDAKEDPQLGPEINRAIEEFTEKLKQAPAADSGEHGVRAVGIEVRTAPGVEPVPDGHLEWLGQAATARDRLRWFVIGSYAIALGLLAGSGFNEVYSKNLTFGADLWIDYLALVLWGFGAEATRDSVASTLRSLGIPLDSRTTDAKT